MRIWVQVKMVDNEKIRLDSFDACWNWMAERKYKVMQQKHEIRGFCIAVSEINSKIIMELGSYQGGTIALLATIAPRARFIVVDSIHPSFYTDRDEPQLKRITLLDALANAGVDVTFVRGALQDRETVEKVRGVVSEGSVDVAFIDADHSYAGVKEHFDLYLPFVREGGIMGLHDISPETGITFGVDTHDVTKLWNEIKAEGWKTKEFMNPEDIMGIGALYKGVRA